MQTIKDKISKIVKKTHKYKQPITDVVFRKSSKIIEIDEQEDYSYKVIKNK